MSEQMDTLLLNTKSFTITAAPLQPCASISLLLDTELDQMLLAMPCIQDQLFEFRTKHDKQMAQLLQN